MLRISMYFNAFHMVSYYDKIYAISEVIQMVNKRLGDVVKQERLKLNLSQNALAEQAKVSLRTVSDIEHITVIPGLIRCMLWRIICIFPSMPYFLTKNRIWILPCNKS